MPCKLTSNTKNITTQRPTLQSSKKQIIYTSYSRKRIIKGVKFHFSEFRLIGPYIIEKVLPNNNYLVRKNGSKKTQVLHRMRMRQFTPRQPPADILITPQEYKPDPDVSLKHDDLYARAWEFDYEQSFFEAENNNATPPNPHEYQMQTDISNEEMRYTPGTAHECPPEIFPQTDEVNDVKDTYPHMEPDLEPSSEQPESSLTNLAVLNTNYLITRNLIALTTTDISLSAELVCSTERARRRSRNSTNAPRGTYVAVQNFLDFLFWLLSGD